MQKPIGLLVMAYGTPRSLDEVESYYTHIRRGRPPSTDQLADLVRRYQAIGGLSPLAQITDAQMAGIEAAANQLEGRPVKAYLGMKHSHPFIADAVKQMAEDGIDTAITLVLAPHYSSMSVGSYQQLAEEAAAECGGPVFLHIDSWHLLPRYIGVLQQRLQSALDRLRNPAAAMVLFTAHSLPARIVESGDPYEQQLRETAEAVARGLGLGNYELAWQSAGRTPEPWLGPDISEVLPVLQERQFREVVICPIGFVSDHLEVLYDIDIDSQAQARGLGLHLVRTESLNADPEFLLALAQAVRDRERSGAGDKR